MLKSPFLEDNKEIITILRVPILIWTLLITLVSIILQFIVDVSILQTIYFIIIMAVHCFLYWNVLPITSFSRLLYVAVQGSIIFISAIIMPAGMPPLLIGLIPVLVAQCFAIYQRIVTVLIFFGILYLSFCLFTLNSIWASDIALFIAILLIMNIVVVSYAILFYRQVNARIRTQSFLEDLEQAHEKVEELTIANERQRMARDLHDTLAQGLAGIIMQLEAIDAYLDRQNTERAKVIITKSMNQARTTLADARSVIDDLRAQSASTLDFDQAVQSEIYRFTAASGIPVQFNFNVIFSLHGKEVEHLLFIIRESLTNIARHAKASVASIDIKTTKTNDLCVHIKDNGVGFNTDKIGMKAGHYGILGMRERVRLIGGRLSIHSGKQGTCIEITIQSVDNKKEAQVGHESQDIDSR